MTTYNDTLTDGLGITGSPIADLLIIITEMMGFTETLSAQQINQIIETLGLDVTLDTLIQAQESVLEEIGFSETYRFVWSLIITEGLGFNDPLTITPSKYVKLIETIAFSGYATNTIQASNIVQAVIGLSDAFLIAGISETILEDIGLSGAYTSLIRAYQKLSEEFSLDDTMTYVLSMFVTVEDNLGLSETIMNNASVKDALIEGLVLTTSFTMDNDTYTGWVMNSENFAVTNYAEYDFTDLAKINNQYYGIQADGVYLLEGDKDDAAFIKAIIRSPKMDFGTSNKKTLTNAYLGFRGDGDLVMKLITDDKTEMWYTLTEEDTGLHTDRLRLAKGIVGRYWQFELVTQNTTELDIDTIEFFPIMFKRKV